MPARRLAQNKTGQAGAVTRSTAAVHPNVILLVSDRADRSLDLHANLQTAGLLKVMRPEDLHADEQSYARVVVDIDLADVGKVRQLRHRLDAPSLKDLPRDFFVGLNMHHARTQAHALGATSILTRPLQADAMLLPIREHAANTFQQALAGQTDELHVGVGGAHRILIKIFEGTRNRQGPTFEDVVAHEAEIAHALHHAQLQGWINIVRQHHNHSYRHCLMVTGFAVAFASHLGMAIDDQIRLARAAMMHDVGKAFTPIAVLDKPGKLTEEETTVMRRHPRQGYDYLVAQAGFPDEVLDVALHHHDLLDGSGYPDRLSGSAIADIVRMITIADIYAALVEDRPYRPAITRQRAFGILNEMGDKLDRDLVRAFGHMTRDAHTG